MPRLIYIAIFGLLGVFARFYVGLSVTKILAPPFPYATFLINIVGAFLIGVIYVLGAERAAISADLRIGIMVGFLGGFTTFSSYCLEASRLLEDGEYWYSALYFVLSPILGLGANLLGLFLTRIITRGAT